MKFLFILFFMLSGTLWLNTQAWAEKGETTSNYAEEADFSELECAGSSMAEEICKKNGHTKENTKKADAKDTVSEATEDAPTDSDVEGEVTGQADAFNEEEGKNKVTGCWTAPEDTETCCAEPTTCLGSEALSTVEQVNNVAVTAGPGVASAFTGFGKDMSGMCSTIQKLAGAGAALALAASTRCKTQISLCKSACNKELKQLCTTYYNLERICNKSKMDCKIPQNSSTHFCKGSPTLYEKNFLEAEKPATDIVKAYKYKKHCQKQAAKAVGWGEKMGQMLNSALSAEMCKRQAGFIRNREECKAKGWEWKNGECVDPGPDVRIAQCEAAGGTWNKKTEKCKPPEKPIEVADTPDPPPIAPPPNPGIPNPDATSPSSSDGPGTSSGSEIGTGGGGDNNQNTAQNNNKKSKKMGMPDVSSDDFLSGDGASDGSLAGGYSGVGGGRSGMLGFFRGGKNYGRNKKKKKGDEDPNNYKMGGGGFGGYAGGGRGGGGDGDFANLRLSKKKLDEIAKKKGAMRKTASAGIGGAHENIFARITRRFKAICQKDFDCR